MVRVDLCEHSLPQEKHLLKELFIKNIYIIPQKQQLRAVNRKYFRISENFICLKVSAECLLYARHSATGDREDSDSLCLLTLLLVCVRFLNGCYNAAIRHI